MRHRRNTNHLSRNAPHARSLLRNMTVSLLTHQQVTTTLANAKATQPFVERIITLGKAGDLSARRHAISLLGGNDRIARRLFTDIAPLFASRQGGYTRIIRLGHRRGDGASLALLELTEQIVVAPPATTKKERRAKAASTETPSAPAEPAKPKASVPPKQSSAPTSSTEQQPPATKPRNLFDGLRKLWGRRQGDRGGSRG